MARSVKKEILKGIEKSEERKMEDELVEEVLNEDNDYAVSDDDDKEVEEEKVSENKLDSDDLMNKIQALSEIVEKQSKIIEQFENNQGSRHIVNLGEAETITIQHLKDYTTCLKLSNKTIKLFRLGETAHVTKTEAMAIMNNYPVAFKEGMITFTDEIGLKLLEQKGLEVGLDYVSKVFDYKKCIDLPKSELIEFFNNLLPAQKDMFIVWWYNEASNNDSRFLDIEIVNALNKATDKRFSKIISEKINKDL